MNKLTIILLTILFGVAPAAAQNVISPIGGDVSGAGGSLSYTCGEIAVKKSVARAITVVNITQTFTEGVQQAFIGNPNSIENPLPFNISVYPNPTQDRVAITIDAEQVNNGLNYTLYNIQGKEISSAEVNNEVTEIDLTGNAAGTYILQLQSNDKSKSNTYKIIKNK